MQDHNVPDLSGKTILQVVPRLDIGGAETTTVQIATAIKQAGGRALVVSEGGRLEADIRAGGGEIIHMPVASKNIWTVWRNSARLSRLILQAGVDIIHARSRAPAWSCYFAAKKCAIPFLTTYHSKVSKGPAIKVFYNAVMTRGQAVIANSQFTADEIERVHKIDRQKIHVIPRGCDTDMLDVTRFNKIQIRAQRRAWGVTDDAFVILCPARLTKWKGQMILLEALTLLAQKNITPYVVLAGDAQGRDAYVAALKARAKTGGIEQNIIFAGLVDDMPRAYAASDITIVPSIEAEPFGRTAIEAQAASRPVIASDAGGFRETITQESGMLVPPQNAQALAQAIERVMALSVKQRTAMGQAARAYVCAHYTTQKMCAATLNCYQDFFHA